MARLAFSPLSDKIEISDIELKRSGKSYTSDTLKYFKENLGVDEILLLCGTDMFVTLDTWHEFEYIFDTATIVCIRRESDTDCERLIEQKRLEYIEKYSAKLEFISVEAIEVSSSEIRKNINSPRAAAQLPPAVYEFIKEKRLYGDLNDE